MQINHSIRYLFWIILLSGVLLSCRRYEDGPLFSIRSAEGRVENNWTAELISRNNIDETNRYDIYDMNFDKDFNFDWTLKLETDTVARFWEGNWIFLSNKERMRLTYLDPTDTTETKFRLDVEILRLKNDEMWIRYLQEGDQFYIRLEPR